MSNFEGILFGPVVTEKATGEKTRNRYVVRVLRSATKVDIKRSIEKLFNVKVIDVNTLMVHGKVLGTMRGRLGRRRSWKKAYVTLSKGQKIEALEAQA
jgi:large subunit ribosomal protein L23